MLAAIARGLLRLGGWTAVGEKPAVAKAVFIAAPHTSNWDGVWALIYKVAHGLDIRFFAKESLFWFPLGTLLRGLGGIPLNRDEPGGAVRQAVEAFDNSDAFYFGLAPEGTRSLRPGWKSGFYRIAMEADVPVILGFLDYENKRLGIGPMLALTGDRDADLARIREFYAGIRGRWPEKTSPVRFT
ncbi:MAG: 1-acyl-sn-glycerol-3-phosphate acyltransferase [Woeseiaceae bacterium]|nr:1-acyl-sn-glycerol-3-phosphate acyltransferase [Woeseiaceae bacterium]